MEILLPLYIIIPLGTAFIIPVIGRLWSGFARLISPVIFLLLLIIGLQHMPVSNQLVYNVGGWQPVDGIPIGISLVLDGFNALLLVIINLMAFLASFYAFSYMQKYTAKNNFYTLLCLMIAGMNGVVLTGDLFNL